MYERTNLQPRGPRVLEVPVLGKEGVHARALRPAEGSGHELAPAQRALELVGLEEAGQSVLEDRLVEPRVVRDELRDRDCVCMCGFGGLGGIGWRDVYVRMCVLGGLGRGLDWLQR